MTIEEFYILQNLHFYFLPQKTMKSEVSAK